MNTNRSLNVDIPGSISEFQSAMKEFLLKRRLYRILLRGKGLEFEAYRNYSQDDDSSTIDWKASSRANTLLVKQYRDERNLKVIFLIDMGENMVSGSAAKLKCEYMAEVISAFAHLIITTGDKPGFIFFNDEVRDFMKPAGGTQHFSRFVDYIRRPENYHGASDLKKAFEFLLSYVNRSVESAVLVSDFVSFDETLKKDLSLISSRFETTMLMIRDSLDNTLPDLSAEIVLEDPRTGEQLLVNPKIAKKVYESISLEQQKLIRASASQNNIDLLEMMTSKPFVPTLSEFLKGRIKTKPRSIK